MKRITLIKLLSMLEALVLCAFILAACTASQGDVPSDSATESNENQPYITPVTVQYFPEEGISKDSCIQYTDEKMHFPSETVLISTTQTVSDFKFLAIQFNVATEKYEIVEELYSLEELTPAQPLMINTTVSETLADRGFCFTDEDGNIRYYYFTYDARGESGNGILCSPANMLITSSTEAKYLPLSATEEALLNVMNNKAVFIAEDGSQTLFVDYKVPGVLDDIDIEADVYTFVDLDQDGTKELAVRCKTAYGLVMIFRYDTDDKAVYGYSVGIRDFLEAKADGRFRGSTSAFIESICQMTFDKTNMEIITLAYKDIRENVYERNGMPVTKEEIETYWSEWESLVTCAWISVDNQ